MSIGAPVGATIGASTADSLGRKPAIIGASSLAILFGSIYPFIRDPRLLPLAGFLLVVCIYILVALLFAIYVPELFPTDVRMRALGLCNTLGRAATIFTPFLVVFLFRARGVAGVVALMIALLVIQILAVHFFGPEPKLRRLEEMQ
jgi:putative MFS transporter